ncbi:MAG: YlxR family protein [Ilumatobacteraceae bacterium]
MTRVRSTEPTRTCVGCRERRAARHMVRCVARDGGRVATASAGRGAWVCSVDCFDRALTASGFARAWKCSTDRDTLAGLRAPVSSALSAIDSMTLTTTVKDCD